ncbi:MAG: cytochrome C oxidase subunit IV family protein [Polyangiales bacterium]
MTMTAYFRGPLFYTWLFLVSATLASALLGLEGKAGVALIVLLIALVKCRVVIRTYMEVHAAPRWLRRSCDAWLLGNALMLSSPYWS